MTKKIKMQFNYFLIFTLTIAVFGCKYEQFNVTEKPYVDKTSVELFVGDGAGSRNTIQLKSSPEGKQYTWSSFDPNIATVSQNGVVTAVSDGFTTISVASGNDVTNVSVWVRNWVPLKNFVLDKSESYGYWLDRFRVNAYFEPSNTTDTEIQWSSSDSDVAKVFEAGWVTCYNPGNAVITARTSSGITRTVDVQVFKSPTFIPRTNWEFPGYYIYDDDGNVIGDNRNEFEATIGFDTQANEGYPNGRVIAMLDGNANTFYHSRWGPDIPYPHWFIVDMKQNVEIQGIHLQRRQGNAGTSNGFELYTATEMPANPTTDPFAPGTWDWTDCGEYSFNRNTNDAQRIMITPPFPTARYVLMYFPNRAPIQNGSFIMFAEFGVYGNIVE